MQASCAWRCVATFPAPNSCQAGFVGQPACCGTAVTFECTAARSLSEVVVHNILLATKALQGSGSCFIQEGPPI
jgi:hypothetical protein